MKLSILGVGVLLCSTTLIACETDRNYPPPMASSSTPVATSSGRTPTQADIDSCNAYAQDQSRSGNTEVLKDAAIGGVGGAAIGAAGGAIADGGSGAGKGAAIGGLAGAAAGTLYGLNEKHRAAPGYEAAYRSCMTQRGY
jgi:uncharacterized protein YcfJ